MISCANPDSLGNLSWFACYLTTPKHVDFYWSFGTVLLFIGLVAPIALGLGLIAALAKRGRLAIFRMFATAYMAMVRGIPEIVFYLFVPLALDQMIEWTRHKILCSQVTEPIWQGNDFVVCAAARMPLNTAPQSSHDLYALVLGLIAFSLVYGAFAANVIDGALKAVPKGQLEAATALGLKPRQVMRKVHIPQMWRYALPGLSNVWQLLIKSTPLLFLMGIEDIIYWARELGAAKSPIYDFPHPDWRIYYFGALLIFYLALTHVSQLFFARLDRHYARGHRVSGGALA